MHQKDILKSRFFSEKSPSIVESQEGCEIPQGQSYFVPLFNIMYYLLLSPFKVKKYGPTGEYILGHNRFQKMICALVHICGVIISIRYSIAHTEGVPFLIVSQSMDIASIFDTVGNLATSAGVVCLIKALWLDQPKVLDFIKASRIQQKRIWKVNVGTLQVLCLCLCMSCAHFGLVMVTSSTSIMVNWTIGRMIKWCQAQIQGEGDDGVVHGLFTVSSKVISSIFYGLFFEGNFIYCFSRVTLMVLSLNFRALGSQFEETVKMEVSIKKVVEKCDSIRDAVEKGNEWSNGLILSHYVGIVSFIAYTPALSYSSARGGFVLYYLIFCYVVLGIFVVISCDLQRRMQNSLKKWMTRKRLDPRLSVEERLLMVSLAQDIDGEAVGLSCPFFTITYSFLGSMVGLVITYGLLVYQLQGGGGVTVALNNLKKQME